MNAADRDRFWNECLDAADALQADYDGVVIAVFEDDYARLHLLMVLRDLLAELIRDLRLGVIKL